MLARGTTPYCAPAVERGAVFCRVEVLRTWLVMKVSTPYLRGPWMH